MPPKYEKWLPNFIDTNAISAEEHMSSRLYCKEVLQAIIQKMNTSSMFTPDISMAN
jgi:hypothetical protein